MLKRCLAVLMIFAALPLRAEPPRVAVDILPVHSLVARVMDGIAVPGLVMPASASPHSHAMRPSEAAALESADVIVWLGPALTPWLADAIVTLATDAHSLTLLDLGETETLAYRDGEDFEVDDHDHDHAHGDHGAPDPHAWLDPENAIAWLRVVADALADADPENADHYRANAKAGAAEIAAVAADLVTTLAPMHDTPFLVFHDSTQYFEARFDLAAAGALSLADGAGPGPAHVAELRDRVAETGVACLLAEPGTNPGLAEAVLGESGARLVEIDPLGVAFEPGPHAYPALLASLGEAFSRCVE